MKFTLSWLKTHLNTDADLPTILKALNDIGLEVEDVENPAEKLGAFRIAKVLSTQPHPQADKLQVLTVEAGEGPLQVVCGAPNAREGLVGVFGTEENRHSRSRIQRHDVFVARTGTGRRS
jgi:phenylalanyl-tRNA synthetase beta chain